MCLVCNVYSAYRQINKIFDEYYQRLLVSMAMLPFCSFVSSSLLTAAALNSSVQKHIMTQPVELFSR